MIVLFDLILSDALISCFDLLQEESAGNVDQDFEELDQYDRLLK